jgi:hypothetical protein
MHASLTCILFTETVGNLVSEIGILAFWNLIKVKNVDNLAQ